MSDNEPESDFDTLITLNKAFIKKNFPKVGASLDLVFGKMAWQLVGENTDALMDLLCELLDRQCQSLTIETTKNTMEKELVKFRETAGMVVQTEKEIITQGYLEDKLGYNEEEEGEEEDMQE